MNTHSLQCAGYGMEQKYAELKAEMRVCVAELLSGLCHCEKCYSRCDCVVLHLVINIEDSCTTQLVHVISLSYKTYCEFLTCGS